MPSYRPNRLVAVAVLLAAAACTRAETEPSRGPDPALTRATPVPGDAPFTIAAQATGAVRRIVQDR